MRRSLQIISGIIGLSVCLCSASWAQTTEPASQPSANQPSANQHSEGQPKAKKPRFETHWVVIMEMGDADLEKDRITELKKQHLRYMDKLEESGEVKLSSGFRVHHDERHRELAFYSGDLERSKVEELVNASPIVKAGHWQPFIYMWMTRNGAVSFDSGG